jgi:hypothetical protein
MALYKLDDETGEAVRCDYDDFLCWSGRLDETTRTLARHEIIEHKQLKALAIDALKCKHHNGKVLATVVTRLRPNTDEHTPPWETLVEGEEPEFHSGTREQALRAHRALVNRTTNAKGGRVLI